MTRRGLFSLLLVLGALGLFATGCGDDDEGGDLLLPDGEVRATCQGCHTSEAKLRATALPDPPPPESEGEG